MDKYRKKFWLFHVPPNGLEDTSYMSLPLYYSIKYTVAFIYFKICFLPYAVRTFKA